MVQRHTAAECLRSPLAEELPLKCQQLKKGFGDCKRGMVDMRKRFRGNMPVAYQSLEKSDAAAAAAAAEKGYQLYGGRPAFAGAARETSGDEKAPRDWREVEAEKLRGEDAAKGAK